MHVDSNGYCMTLKWRDGHLTKMSKNWKDSTYSRESLTLSLQTWRIHRHFGSISKTSHPGKNQKSRMKLWFMELQLTILNRYLITGPQNFRNCLHLHKPHLHNNNILIILQPRIEGGRQIWTWRKKWQVWMPDSPMDAVINECLKWYSKKSINYTV